MRLIIMILIMSATIVFADVPVVDTNASFTGPFSGASGQSEMAQSFVITESGFLQAIEAYVPSSPGPSCQFSWYLRDGATLDPGNPDISLLPVLLSGTGMTDVPPGGIYESTGSVLVTNANLLVDAGDLLVLHIMRDCNFTWVSGGGDLGGEQYKYLGGVWAAASVSGHEFGRTISTSGSVETDQKSWGSLKTLFR